MIQTILVATVVVVIGYSFFSTTSTDLVFLSLLRWPEKGDKSDTHSEADSTFRYMLHIWVQCGNGSEIMQHIYMQNPAFQIWSEAHFHSISYWKKVWIGWKKLNLQLTDHNLCHNAYHYQKWATIVCLIFFSRVLWCVDYQHKMWFAKNNVARLRAN